VATLLKPTGRLLVVEPRGHVKPAEFQAMMEECRQAGFQQLEAPEIGNKQLAALHAPPQR